MHIKKRIPRTLQEANASKRNLKIRPRATAVQISIGIFKMGLNEADVIFIMVADYQSKMKKKENHKTFGQLWSIFDVHFNRSPYKHQNTVGFYHTLYARYINSKSD